MVDYAEITKHLYKDTPNYDLLQYEASYRSGWNKFFLKGCTDVEVWHNEPNNLLKVKGSLPYYWQGHNFSFDQKSLHGSIQNLSERLKINLWDAELSRFEYGCIVEVQTAPKELIRQHIKIKGMKTCPINEYAKYFKGGYQSLKIYDAGRNIKNKLDRAVRGLLTKDFGYDKGKDYLKVENQYKKPYMVLNRGMRILVNDLLIPEFIEKCKADLLTQYRSITKTSSLQLPNNKKALTTGNIILLALKDIESRYDFNAEELINLKLKEIPKEILNQNDKKARRRVIKKMLKELSVPDEPNGKNDNDLAHILEEKLMLEN